MQMNAGDRYAPALRWLHWISFALVLIAYVAINVRGLFPRGSEGRADSLAIHALAGIAVLLLVLPRLSTRLKHPSPPIVPAMDKWSQALSKITHVALYAFLIAQPIMGIVTLQIAGKPVSLFGVTVLPAFFGAGDRELAHPWEDVHGLVGEIFYYVIGLHILAALWHHFGRKDNTLRRMA
ncbi:MULTISPECIES: cytochrome b [Dyella]|nr:MULTISPECIES: cytochrome b [Dyella]